MALIRTPAEGSSTKPPTPEVKDTKHLEKEPFVRKVAIVQGFCSQEEKEMTLRSEQGSLD